MSATLESPGPWRKAEQFVTNGLFRSRSTQFDLAAKAGGQPCAAEVPNSGRWRQGDGVVFERQSVVVNGIGCSPSASPNLRRRVGLSSLNKLCHHLQINVSCLRPERSRLLSQSSEAISSPRVQTAPVVLPKPEPEQRRQQRTSVVVPKPCFSAPVEGSAATVVVGPGIQDAADGSGRALITSVRCELVAGLVDECSVVDQLMVIDCRSFVSYNSNHVRGALNISCADCISRKRLLTGRVTIGDLVSGSDDAKSRYQRAAEVVRSGNKNAVQVIVYDEDTVNYDDLPASSPLRLVVSCLLKTGFDVYYMFGELPCFCGSWNDSGMSDCLKAARRRQAPKTR